MAWWPFGKKKPGEAEDPQAGAHAQAQGRPDVPLTDDPPGFDPGIPQVPQGAGDEDGSGGVTIQVPPPLGAHAGPPPSTDPFAPAQGEDHFARTLEDPEASANLAASPVNAPDPFAPAAPNDHFSATIEDSDQGSVASGLGADPFARTPGSAGYGSGQVPASAEMPTLFAPAGSGAQDPFRPAGDPGFAPAPHDFGTPDFAPPDFAPHDDFATGAPTIQLGAGAAAAAYADPPDAHEMTTPLAFTGSPPLGLAPPGTPFGSPPAAMASSPGRPATPRMTPLEENVPMAANPTNAPASLSADKRRLGLALLAGGPITHERLLLELDRSGKSNSVLGKALLQSNFPREEELLAVLVARVRIPKINVKNTKIPLDTIRILPGEVARKTKTLPIEKIGDILVVVSPDIGDEGALQAVRQATGCLISPIQCAPEGFDEILEGYYDRLGAAPTTAPPSPDPNAAPASVPEPAQTQSTPAGAGVVAALPADEGSEDSWDRVYTNPGPISAEEALL